MSSSWRGSLRREYALDMRVVGIGSGNRVVDLLDTIRIFTAPAGLASGSAIFAVIDVPLFPEAPTLGIMVGDPSRRVGAIAYSDPLAPPQLLAGALAASELLLGSDALDVRWETRNVRVNPLEFSGRGTGIRLL